MREAPTPSSSRIRRRVDSSRPPVVDTMVDASGLPTSVAALKFAPPLPPLAESRPKRLRHNSMRLSVRSWPLTLFHEQHIVLSHPIEDDGEVLGAIVLRSDLRRMDQRSRALLQVIVERRAG